MIKKISLLLMFIISFLQADTMLEVMKKENRVALVIGNNNYQRPLSVLSNPINDANIMKKILKKIGFDVIYSENITKREMRLKLEKFYSKIKKGGVGLLYFSGHGIEINGRNYLIPIDANLSEEIDVEFDSIILDRITKKMLSSKNRLNIVILDACRNNPFTKGLNGGLAEITPPVGLFVSYSTGAGKVALDGIPGQNGVFTKYLVKYIQQKGLTLQDVFKKTREDVYKSSHKKQFPAIYDQTINGGEFFFIIPDENSSIVKDENLIREYISNNNSIIEYIYISLKTIIDYLISDSKSKSLNTIFIIFFIFGFSLILFTSITSFLYSERTNYILKVLAISIFFFGISGYMMSTFLQISDKLSLFSSVIISTFIFIIIVFLAPKQNKSKLSIKPISLIGCQAILLDDIKIGNTGHANIETNSSRYRKLVRNKYTKNLFKGDKVIVMSDEAIPTVSKK